MVYDRLRKKYILRQKEKTQKLSWRWALLVYLETNQMEVLLENGMIGW